MAVSLLFCSSCGDEVEMDGSEPVDDDALVADGEVMCGDCRREERNDDDVDEESIGW
jgi:uncharacterized CHY-type Zn-finger protein